MADSKCFSRAKELIKKLVTEIGTQYVFNGSDEAEEIRSELDDLWYHGLSAEERTDLGKYSASLPHKLSEQ